VLHVDNLVAPVGGLASCATHLAETPYKMNSANDMRLNIYQYVPQIEQSDVDWKDRRTVATRGHRSKAETAPDAASEHAGVRRRRIVRLTCAVHVPVCC